MLRTISVLNRSRLPVPLFHLSPLFRRLAVLSTLPTRIIHLITLLVHPVSRESSICRILAVERDVSLLWKCAHQVLAAVNNLARLFLKLLGILTGLPTRKSGLGFRESISNSFQQSLMLGLDSGKVGPDARCAQPAVGMVQTLP